MGPTLRYERQLLREGYACIAGLDEVGRGSLAGPVVAASVVLPVRSRSRMRALAGLDDSKVLAPVTRDNLYRVILAVADAIGIGWASHHVIDRDGIAAANRRALLRAVNNCTRSPDVLLIDYFALPESALPQVPLTRGDSLSLSIAAASVVAKVVRDHWMSRWDRTFPGYGFARHKGYATAGHRDALTQLGPCLLHRRTFLSVGAPR